MRRDLTGGAGRTQLCLLFEGEVFHQHMSAGAMLYVQHIKLCKLCELNSYFAVHNTTQPSSRVPAMGQKLD